MNKGQLSQQIWDKTSGWIDGIGTVVNQLAKQLGVAAAHVYEVYTRQMFVEGLTYSIISFTIAITVLILIIKTYKWVAKYNDGYDEWGEGSVILVIFVTLAGGGLFFGMIFGVFTENIMKVFNPEYYTMKEIFDMVKSATK